MPSLLSVETESAAATPTPVSPGVAGGGAKGPAKSTEPLTIPTEILTGDQVAKIDSVLPEDIKWVSLCVSLCRCAIVGCVTVPPCG